MKTLSVGDRILKAEKIVKTYDSIIGYNGDVEVFRFKGIEDFDFFILDTGDVFDFPDMTIEELTVALAENQIQQAQTQVLLDQALVLITELQIRLQGVML